MICTCIGFDFIRTLKKKQKDILQTILCIFQNAMCDTFIYTNIYPEYKNNKMWSAVEIYIREKVLKDFKEVRIYVIPAFKSKSSDPFVVYPVR